MGCLKTAGAAFACAALLALSGCQTTGRQSAETGTLIRNVSVIPMDRPGILVNQDVLIRDGRIAGVGRTGSLGGRPADVVDGTGKFVIPGLWDMHVHALMEGEVESTFQQYADHGVVGVRDLGSTLEELRAARSAATRPGLLPTVVASGPLIDGPRQPWTQRVAVTTQTAEEARAAAEQIVSNGADFLKVYNLLTREQYEAVAEVARARGLPFAGHVPFQLSVEEVSKAGQASIEHAGTQLVADCIPNGRRAIPAELNAWISRGYAGRSQERLRWWAMRDRPGCAALYERMAARRTWVTPTLTNEIQGVAWTEQQITQLPGRQAEACRSNLASMRVDPAVRDAADQLILDLVRELHQAGVPLLAGTDTPNGCLAPGASLHVELELLVRAGLTPWEALAAATINSARFLRRPEEGAIRTGAVASLLLLDANPLADIRATTKLAGVMVRGTWHRHPRVPTRAASIAARGELPSLLP